MIPVTPAQAGMTYFGSFTLKLTLYPKENLPEAYKISHDELKLSNPVLDAGANFVYVINNPGS